MEKVNQEDFREQLQKEIYKPNRKTKEYKKVVSNGVDDIWTADVVFLNRYKENNIKNGTTYTMLLNVVDVFSRYAWSIPIKGQAPTGKEISKALNTIIEKNERPPHKLWVDKGSEFYNKEVKEILDKYDIKIYSTYGDSKASIVERFNRTLKEKLGRFFIKNDTYNWIDNIDDIINTYNKTKHSSLPDMSPAKAHNNLNEIEENEVWNYQYGEVQTAKKGKPKFKVGDYVRIPTKKGAFERVDIENWTFEVFIVSGVNNKKPILYKLTDLKGEPIEGSFYENELQKTKQKDVFLMEEILDRKGDKVLVKWKGYKNPTWEPKENYE